MLKLNNNIYSNNKDRSEDMIIILKKYNLRLEKEEIRRTIEGTLSNIFIRF
jgi:hypothetical protein